MRKRPPGQNLYYTLIGDAAAYKEADAPWDDEVVEAGLEKVKELNEKYGAHIFNFVYRKRAWSEGEQTWLGHERKRGAILHFNDLVLGQTSEEEKEKRFRCETISQWLKGVESGVQFIITLDTDTELVLYSAQKLIGAMAHPLNRAQLSPDGRRVDRGYGIMQPRVNVDVEVTNKSRFAQLFAGLGGLDVYTTASFELYQDIFNEGSFCGKGIYDLRVFQQVLKGTFPENLILSHDLIEGCHIRCCLINDVELFDDNPSNYIDDAKRHHRWTRGDWQIIPWLKKTVRNEKGEKVRNQVNTIGRWKIFDNLRRSMLSLSLLVLILVGYVLMTTKTPMFIPPSWFVLVALIAVASPIVFFIVGQVTKLPRFGKRYRYYMTLMRGFTVIVYRSLVQFALLPKEAWMYTDAAVRACYRMWFSHRNLLAWITSDEAAKSTKGTLGDYLGKFWFNYVASAALFCLALLGHVGTGAWGAASFCMVTWCGAPFLMYWLGKKFPQDKKHLNEKETEEVRQLAQDTWHFFDSLIAEENNWLIPDNYQLNREQKTDYKTSPTNIGYSLTAMVSAAELGFITEKEAVSRIAQIIHTVNRLEKWNGPKVQRLIDQTDFSKLYNPELDVFSIGYDTTNYTLLPYHYNNFASEARLTSFLTIAQGDAPYKHWFCLDKTLVQYKGYKGVASWYGTLFEYFMPLIFLPTYKHTLMDETYSFAIRAQRAFIFPSPWGISETAYNELDDAQNYKYHAFGVPYLKFQNTTPDRIVVSPYSSLMTIGIDDRAVYENMKKFKGTGHVRRLRILRELRRRGPCARESPLRPPPGHDSRLAGQLPRRPLPAALLHAGTRHAQHGDPAEGEGAGETLYRPQGDAVQALPLLEGADRKRRTRLRHHRQRAGDGRHQQRPVHGPDERPRQRLLALPQHHAQPLPQDLGRPLRHLPLYPQPAQRPAVVQHLCAAGRDARRLSRELRQRQDELPARRRRHRDEDRGDGAERPQRRDPPHHLHQQQRPGCRPGVDHLRRSAAGTGRGG